MSKSSPAEYATYQKEGKQPGQGSSTNVQHMLAQEKVLMHFSGWRGRPKCLQMSREVLKFWAHCGESGGWAVMKSSR